MKLNNVKNTCGCETAACSTKEEISAGLGGYLAFLLPGLVLWGVLYHFLAPAAHWLTYSLLGLATQSHLASAVEFFFFDTPKVLMLLTLIVFGVGIIRSFFTPERTRKMLAGKREFFGNVLAGALGIVIGDRAVLHAQTLASIKAVLTEEQYTLLCSLAKEQGKPVSALIREAIEQVYLKEAIRRRRQSAVERLIALSAPVADWERMEEEILRGALDE